MLYILEGCDGAGKSTVAAQLKEILDAEIVHCSQYTPNDFKFFKAIACSAQDRNIIADRFCYGQFVYQEEKDRPLRVSAEIPALSVLNALETFMLGVGVKVIHVTAPVDEIKDRLLLRGESLMNGLTVEDIELKYASIRELSILPWIDWNTGGEQ